MTLQRSPEQGPARSIEKQILERIGFHVDQALRMQEIVESRQPESPKEIRPLKLLTDASIIDVNARLLSCSPSLERMLLQPGILRLRTGRLEAFSANLQSKLAKAIGEAASGAVKEIVLWNRKLRLRLLPLVRETGTFLPVKLIVLLAESLPDQIVGPAKSASEKYRLTSSEGAIVSLLITGASLKEIAEQRSVSVWTVRTQMKSIFQKMEVRSQREVLARFRAPTD
ncbi:MAG: helix-turn-helix transcriptional regulator [Pseudomonadales bacterium]